MAKNFNGVSTELIDNKTLLRLNIYILATKYLEKKASYFTKATKDNKKANEDSKEVEMVSNSEKEIKKKGFI